MSGVASFRVLVGSAEAFKGAIRWLLLAERALMQKPMFL
jgi:hypothetical protein